MKLIAAILCMLSSAALAQFPDKPLRLIVPQAPGSASDNIARLLVPEFGKALGQPVVVENRPGGMFVIGMDAVAKAPPDGYTLGLGVIGAIAIAPNMLAKPPYDVTRDFQAIGRIATNQIMLAVAANAPFRNVVELIAYAKEHPGKLMNASSANGSPGHLAGELFKQMTGTQIVHIPYKGGAAAINDLNGFRVQAARRPVCGVLDSLAMDHNFPGLTIKHGGDLAL